MAGTWFTIPWFQASVIDDIISLDASRQSWWAEPSLLLELWLGDGFFQLIEDAVGFQRPLIDMGTTSKVEHFDRVASYLHDPVCLEVDSKNVWWWQSGDQNNHQQACKRVVHADGWSECLCKTGENGEVMTKTMSRYSSVMVLARVLNRKGPISRAYPLVICYSLLLKMAHRNSGFTHYKCWFSSSQKGNVYQRVHFATRMSFLRRPSRWRDLDKTGALPVNFNLIRWLGKSIINNYYRL